MRPSVGTKRVRSTFGVFTRDARKAGAFLSQTASLIAATPAVSSEPPIDAPASKAAREGSRGRNGTPEPESVDPADACAPAAFLTATITSPPYGRLVDYGSDRQIGHGQSDEEYRADCQRLFRDLYTWTRPEGSLWLIADSFTDEHRSAKKPGRLRPLPFELAALAEAEGWVLKDVVIWHKDRTLPWSHHGRMRNAFEYVLLLVKTPKFKYHIDRLRDAGDLARWWVRYPERYHTGGKAPDNVWHIPIPVQGSWGRKAYQHACPLPPELVRRLVLLSTDPGDVVYDPFAGIGTVPAVATALDRRGLGTELNATFVRHYRRHVSAEVGSLITAATRHSDGGPTPATLATLRALKFPKALQARVRAEQPDLPTPKLAIGRIASPTPLEDATLRRSIVTASWSFLLPHSTIETREILQTAMKEIASRVPLTKFGVAADIRVIDAAEAERLLGESVWHVYEHGRTWTSRRTVTCEDALALNLSELRGSFIPIIADQRVDIDPNLVGDPAADPY